MKRQAPPLEAIEAFIVATGVPSFRMAADILALSPSALSRRIQALEAFVGVTLFDREGGTVALTAPGRRYLAEVQPALDAIRRATVDLKTEKQNGPLRIVTPQSFAIGWLIPRLHDFVEASDGHRIGLRIGHDVTELRKGTADIAILVGPMRPNGMEIETIIDLEAVPATAPRMLHGVQPPASIDELHLHPRLETFRPAGVWNHWLAEMRYEGPPLQAPTRYEAQLLVLEAAAAGLGVALALPVLASRFFSEGRLIPCFDGCAPIGVNYSLVYADATIRRRKDTRHFAAWLKDELTKTQQAVLAAYGDPKIY